MEERAARKSAFPPRIYARDKGHKAIGPWSEKRTSPGESGVGAPPPWCPEADYPNPFSGQGSSRTVSTLTHGATLPVYVDVLSAGYRVLNAAYALSRNRANLRLITPSRKCPLFPTFLRSVCSLFLVSI